MFYYCLKILGLAGSKRLSCSEINHAIWLKKRRQKNSRTLGGLYSSGGSNDIKNEIQEVAFDSKYKHIPLLIEREDHRNDFSSTKMSPQDEYSGLILNFHDTKLVLKAAIGRVLILTDSWWEEISSLLEEAQMLPNIRIVKWFVTNGEDLSLSGFSESVRNHTEIPHILVKNEKFATKEGSGLSEDLRCSGAGGWDLLEDSKYSGAVKKSLVVSYTEFDEPVDESVWDKLDPSLDIDEEILSCFAESGQFENLVEFSKEFKLGDFGKPSTSCSDGKRFASFWD